MGDKDETFADDLLVGATALAFFIFGSDDDDTRRKIYGMSEKDKKALGLFRMGKLICGRRTTIRQKIAALEEGRPAREQVSN